MKKGLKLYSILFQKCPKCHEGDLFSDPNPFHFKNMFDMPESCPRCHQRYQLEPSFFYGAMYVNYGLTVAIGVAVYVTMIVLGSNWELHHYLIGIIGALTVTAPLTFRLGRAIWINFFVKYDPHILDQKTK